MTRIDGIDVSHWNGRIDWPAVAATGITYAACKATDGRSGVDSEFGRNWAAMRAAGIHYRVAYHYVQSSDPATQADHFLDVVGALQPGEGVAADCEQAGVNASTFDAFVDRLAARLGDRVPLYYSGSYVPGFANMGEWPLWFAAYTGESHAAELAGRPWAIWQWSSTGRIAGVAGDVDVNRVDDTRALDRVCGYDSEGEFTMDKEAEARFDKLEQMVGSMGSALNAHIEQETKTQQMVGSVGSAVNADIRIDDATQKALDDS